MITKEQVLKNLKELIGKEYFYNGSQENRGMDDMYNDTVCAFEDYEENEETYVIVSDNSCYIDHADSTEFCFETEDIWGDVKDENGEVAGEIVIGKKYVAFWIWWKIAMDGDW